MGRDDYKKLLNIFQYKCVPFIKTNLSVYSAMRAKLGASIDLKKIVSRLTYTIKKNLTLKLDEWYEIYKTFLMKKAYPQLLENLTIPY